MPRLRNAIAAAVWLAPIVSCASILDIQTAKHDPALDSQTDAGSLCDVYCDTVQAACTGSFEQYVSKAVCLDWCAKLDVGPDGGDSGNTVSCRLTYALAAKDAGELDVNCPAAGPGGNGVCGSNCEGLCTVDLKTCTGTNATYASVDDCMTACAAVPDLASPDDGGVPTPYNTSIESGFSVQCRLYHLGAAQIGPGTHCPHAAGISKCALATP